MRLIDIDPVPALLTRLRSQGLAASSFAAGRPLRLSRAPGRLDVMGGIADYTGCVVCEMPLAVGTAVALQQRNDRQVQVMSFNRLDEHEPFVAGISLDELGKASLQELSRDFGEPGRKWAAYVFGCLAILHEQGYMDLCDVRHNGLNLAVYSTIPIGGGVSSSAALEVATMVNLIDHFDIASLHAGSENRTSSRAPRLGPNGEASPSAYEMTVASLCQQVENRIVGAPCGIMDQVTSLLGQEGQLLRLLCQPHTLLPPLPLPAGVKAVGVFTGVRHEVAGDAYGRTRAAAFMGHRMILEQMRRLGAQGGKTMTGDPTGGYLANLLLDDYKMLFRPMLPELMNGSDFIERFGSHGDSYTAIAPGQSYAIRDACDHHVLEAKRVQRFVDFLERSNEIGPSRALRSAGHLMYASHRSYVEHAHLGHEHADMLVDLVKERQAAGLYGARITGGGCGGTVAILMEASPQAEEAVAQLLVAYQRRTSRRPTLLAGSSPGARTTEAVL